MFHKNLCMRWDAWVDAFLWWSCQSPVACSCILLNHLSSFCGGMFKLNAKFDADSLLYSLSHFECDSHTVHMLTQWCLPPPLTGIVKSSLFTHVHSSPLSSAVRLHQCHTKPIIIILTVAGLFPDRPHHKAFKQSTSYVLSLYVLWSWASQILGAGL